MTCRRIEWRLHPKTRHATLRHAMHVRLHRGFVPSSRKMDKWAWKADLSYQTQWDEGDFWSACGFKWCCEAVHCAMLVQVVPLIKRFNLEWENSQWTSFLGDRSAPVYRVKIQYQYNFYAVCHENFFVFLGLLMMFVSRICFLPGTWPLAHCKQLTARCSLPCVCMCLCVCVWCAWCARVLACLKPCFQEESSYTSCLEVQTEPYILIATNQHVLWLQIPCPWMAASCSTSLLS